MELKEKVDLGYKMLLAPQFTNKFAFKKKVMQNNSMKVNNKIVIEIY